MRYIALIISFMLFNQSLTVCAPSLFMSAHSKKEATCMSHTSLDQNDSSKSCCSKKTEASENQSHDDGCCDDGCKCLCCVKAFVNNFYPSQQKEFDNSLNIDQIILPIFFNSFDFHQTIITPPKKK